MSERSLEQYAQFSNYAIASATVVLGLAFLAYLVQWAVARKVVAEPVLVTAGGESETVVEPASEETETRFTMAGSIGYSLTSLAALVLLAGLVTRGLAAERVPWGNMYEFGCAAVMCALIAYLVLVKVWDIDWVGSIITGIGTVVLGASMLVYVPAGPLVPALHSYWLVMHVLAAMIAGAAFVIGAAASALFLVKSRAEKRTPEEARTGMLWRMPSAARMDQLAYRVNAFAFPVWTFAALISGPIWAQYAWGRYWGWDPKEVWAFITWVVYAGYLHARATAGWKGKAAAILCLVGFATFVFNFVGVNLFVPGLHSYAK